MRIILVNMLNIALEGIDGAGKSTQIGLLEKKLVQEGLPVVVWHYTNKDNFWGQLIKSIFSQNGGTPKRKINSRYLQELLYAMSSRASFNKTKSEHSLSENTILISDRSIITAYASHIGRIPIWFMDRVELKVSPNVAVYLDLPPEEGMRRISGRLVGYSDETLEELKYFRECYELLMGDKRPSRLKNTKFIRVDANASKETVAQEVYKVIKDELNKGRKYGQR